MSGDASTDLLYQLDAYLREAEAVVVAINNETRSVALDGTFCYPGGGGQLPDTGHLVESVTGHDRPVIGWHKGGGGLARDGRR